MRVIATLLIAASALAGCAGRHATGTVGNFLQASSQADDKIMAGDVAGKIGAMYPPARTGITMLQATPDVFGNSLVLALRTKGYALAEFGKKQPVRQVDRNPAASPTTDSDLSLAYIVDQPLDTTTYRVTVLVNDKSLSRLYQAKDGGLVPAGYWVRKE